MSDLESIGDAATGMLVAGAVDQSSGHPPHGHFHERRCLNCNADLTGNFCANCGQKAHVHRTLGGFFHDLIHGAFHFEGKFWRTLPMLALRPGELTRRYIDGERARFVSPIAIFLFSIFLMFAVVNSIGGPFHVDSTVSDLARARAELAEEKQQGEARIAELEKQRAAAVAAGEPTADLDAELIEARRELQLAMTIGEAAIKREAAQQQRERAQEQRDAAAAEGSADGTTTSGGKFGNVDTGVPALDRAVAKANKNPELLFYKVQTNAYKFSWALIPLSVPFVWLLFLHRRRYRTHYGVYDHTIFVTYSMAFMSLGFSVLTLLRPLGIGDWLPGLAIAFVPPVHIYKQLRRTYDLSRWSALWRTIVLILSTSVALGLFIAMLFVVGALG